MLMLLFCMADAELQVCCWFADQGPWLPAFSCTACCRIAQGWRGI